MPGTTPDRRDSETRQASDEHRTIVGGRPSSDVRPSETEGGIERLLAAAASDAATRTAVRNDPAAAARDLGIELTSTEWSILEAASSDQIEVMAEALAAGAHNRRRFLATAAGAAVAVAAGVGSEAQERQPSTRLRGHIASRPIRWETSLDDALAKAKTQGRPLMLVFWAPTADVTTTAGESMEFLNLGAFSQGSQINHFLDAVGCLCVSLPSLTAGPDDPGASAERLAITREEYLVTKVPTVLFLLPDGTEHRRLVLPRSVEPLVEAIDALGRLDLRPVGTGSAPGSP